MRKLLLSLSVAALILTSCSKEEIAGVEEVKINLYDEILETFEGVTENRVLENVNGIDFTETVYYEFLDANSMRVATLYNNEDCLDDGEEFQIIYIDLVENNPDYFKFTFGDDFEIRGYRWPEYLDVNGTISEIYKEQSYELTNWLPSGCN